MTALARLYALLADERGLLAETLVSPPSPDADEAVFGPLAAGGERSSINRDDYALLVESVLEGYLLHYSRGRIVVPEDPDLRLLAGDQLYALGLVRLARLGDLDAVEELADLISLCAHVHALALPARDGVKPWALTGALWALASLALAGGGWAEQRDAKEGVRACDPDAAERALGVARDGARRLGLGTQLERALIAFDRAVSASGSTT
jgi:hypothetical protein